MKTKKKKTKSVKKGKKKAKIVPLTPEQVREADRFIDSWEKLLKEELQQQAKEENGLPPIVMSGDGKIPVVSWVVSSLRSIFGLRRK